MKNTIVKIAAASLLGAAIFAVPALSRAADSTNTPVAASEPSGPAKFYGPVTVVDTNAMTFTVGDQTFTVTSESHLTKAGKPATLADAVVGEPARGTYTTGKGGKLDITKARFGKSSKGGSKGGGKKKKNSTGSDTSPGADTTTSTNTPSAN